MIQCSVIIVNYNTGAMLKVVVDAALNSQQVAEILVIDNNSQDNSMELLTEDKTIGKYYRKENHGFASSCNYGAKRAHHDYLLFLNPDCVMNHIKLKDLLKEWENNHNVGIVGCRINNPDGSEQRASRRRLPTLWRAIKTYTGIERLANLCNCFAGVNLNHQPMPIVTTQVEAISGAFILMKAKIYQEIKGFDEQFPLHFEDLDLFKRVIDQGYTLLFNPHNSAVHHQGLSSHSNPNVAALKKQGLIRYFQKHNSLVSSFIIKIIVKIL